MFGKVTVQIKLVEGDSAGTVTAFYVSIFNSIEAKKIKFLPFISASWNRIDCCLAGLSHDPDLCLSPFKKNVLSCRQFLNLDSFALMSRLVLKH